MIDKLHELRAIERKLSELEERKAELRLDLENRTREIGGTAEIAGIAHLHVIPPSQSHRYDIKVLAQVIADMVATGDMDLMDWARRIAQARQMTERSAWLRISWNKTLQ